MERRNFLKGALAIFGVAVAGVAASTGSAEAASLDTLKATPKLPDAEPVEAAATAEPDADGQFYFRRRYRRRYYYRPRRRVYYYRRPVYYRRPRYRVYW